MPVTNPSSPPPPSPPLAMMGGSDNGASSSGGGSSISSSISSSNAASTKLASLQNLLTTHEPCRFTIAALSVFLILQFAIGFRLFRSWQLRRHRTQRQWKNLDTKSARSTSSTRSASKTSDYPDEKTQHIVAARSIMDEEAAALLSAAPIPTTESAAGVSGAENAETTETTENQLAHTVDIVATRSASLPPLPSEADMYYASFRLDGAGRPFPRHLPPPPPLTPPALADAVFSLGTAAAPATTAAVPNELDATCPSDLGLGAAAEVSFIHQPNPDYTAELDMPPRPDTDVSAAPATPSAPTSPTSPGSPVSPRRRNYTRFVPVGTPAWLPAPTVELAPGQSAAAGDAAAAMEGGAVTSPSYGPQASGFGREPAAREIGLRGEIISALDDAGAGWKRHTRVYGGGVCLACLAAETKNAGGVSSRPLLGDAAVAAAVAAATQAPSLSALSSQAPPPPADR